MLILCKITLAILICLSIIFKSQTQSAQKDGKLRVCIVESRGTYRKTPKFCPILEANSNMECVVGVDRLDCVRRIHKGTAHFGVLKPEDLVAARWASVEILVTSELRSHPTSNFEYDLVAVVSNEAGIHTVHDLRGSKLCHPGLHLQSHWNIILGNYLESTMVPRSCDPEITLTEDRIRASSKFFGPSCKAGPWVPDPKYDRILKSRYPSLCQICYYPYECDEHDKHWGRRGALYCLTSGGGDVAWARLDDVQSHFGLTGLAPQDEPSDYSFLCPNGHLQPINTTRPCVWVSQPWPVIAARRSHAAQVQRIVGNLNHDDPQSWENALLSLLETYHVNINTLDNVIPIDDYLDQAVAFQGAYSFPECNPPRSIVFCTVSIIEHIKCSWLQEAAQVFGVDPNIQCIRSTNLEMCMSDTKYMKADVVIVDQEERIKAQRDYGLIPLLFEFASNMHDRYSIIAVVHKDSTFQTFNDLRGARACVPSFEGAAYLSVQETIANLTQENTALPDFFHYNSCSWHPNSHRECPKHYHGDEGALRCLAEGADVAFLSSETYKNYTVGNLSASWVADTRHKSFRVLCPYGRNERSSKFEYCYMHWTPRGHLMVHNSTKIRHHEIYDSLREIDHLFGKHYQSETRPFTMYGEFDRQKNIIFRDATDELRGLEDMQRDISKRTMEEIFKKYSDGLYGHVESNNAKVLSRSSINKLIGITILCFCINIIYGV